MNLMCDLLPDANGSQLVIYEVQISTNKRTLHQTFQIFILTMTSKSELVLINQEVVK